MGTQINAKKAGAKSLDMAIGNKMTKKQATSNGVYVVQSVEGNRRRWAKGRLEKSEAHQLRLQKLKEAHRAEPRNAKVSIKEEVEKPRKHV